MKITYTGRQVELKPAQLKKLEARFSKIGRLLDAGRKECEVHVILSSERHLHKAEATINYYNHQMAGFGSNADLFQAIDAASEKLEKQCVKTRTKFRDSKRTPHKAAPEVETEKPAAAEASEPEPEVESRVNRVKPHQKQKPMTLEEAMLEMDGRRDYLVYRDAQTDRVNVLVRRRDGHFDLVEE
ncbi:MAG: ribosomal protein / sigma 54 modulation protein [Candidatus Solibacter sp.]|jgi:putative sigma-54 modulation protein|nr:ribosomal protein / sigma 54 modulation protein [Candidatus Solibacter sp.]